MLLYGTCTVQLFFFTLSIYHAFNRRHKEISQKTAEEEERFRKEMAKYAANFCSSSSSFSIVLACVKFLGSLNLCWLSSAGLRLQRGSTTKSGRRTGESKTGPRALRALRAPSLQRARHPSHLRKKQPQKPRVLVRTPERFFF